MDYLRWISRANRVPNDRNRLQTEGFASLCPWLTRSEDFRIVAEISYCKMITKWAMWSPLCFSVEFSSVDFSCQSSAKQSESTPNRRIWDLLAFPHKITRVSKSCRNFAFQRGNHMSHVLTSLANKILLIFSNLA